MVGREEKKDIKKREINVINEFKRLINHVEDCLQDHNLNKVMFIYNVHKQPNEQLVIVI